jgi:hypothetical protein
MARFSDLPVEIIEKVTAELVDASAARASCLGLAALAATCRLCYAVANPLLYCSEMEQMSKASWVVSWAAATDRLDTLDRAVAYGANVTASWTGRFFLDWLLTKRWDRFHVPTETAIYSFTALHIASTASNDAIVSRLLDHGADIDALAPGYPCPCRSPWGRTNCWTSLQLAICHGHASTAQMLTDRGARLEPTDAHLTNQTALHRAAFSNMFSIFESLVKRGCSLNARMSSGSTALCVAVEGRHDESIDELIRLGADVGAGSVSPLTLAIQDCNFNLALRLIDDSEAPVNCTSMGYSLLHLVRLQQFFPNDNHPPLGDWRTLTSRLLELGLDINAKSKPDYHDFGETPLIRAAEDPVINLELMELFVRAGANVHAQNNASETALQVVLKYFLESKHRKRNSEQEKHSHFEAINLLLEAGAAVDGCRERFDELFIREVRKSVSDHTTTGRETPRACTHRQSKSYLRPLLVSIQKVPLPRSEPWIWLDNAIEHFLEHEWHGHGPYVCDCGEPHFIDVIVGLCTRPLPRECLDKPLLAAVDCGAAPACRALFRAGATLRVDRIHLKDKFSGKILSKYIEPLELERLMAGDVETVELDEERAMAAVEDVRPLIRWETD